VVPWSPAACLTWYGIHLTLTIFCNQGPKVRERIHLLQLLILNEYVARHAVAHHYLLRVAEITVVNKTVIPFSALAGDGQGYMYHQTFSVGAYGLASEVTQEQETS